MQYLRQVLSLPVNAFGILSYQVAADESAPRAEGVRVSGSCTAVIDSLACWYKAVNTTQEPEGQALARKSLIHTHSIVFAECIVP